MLSALSTQIGFLVLIVVANLTGAYLSATIHFMGGEYTVGYVVAGVLVLSNLNKVYKALVVADIHIPKRIKKIFNDYDDEIK